MYGKRFDRCGNNYGWVRFEGSRCTEYSEDEYGVCADTDRSGYTFPIFEYCHFDYDSSISSEDDYTGGNDICGDRSVLGTTVIGERLRIRKRTSFSMKPIGCSEHGLLFTDNARVGMSRRY